MAAFDFLSALLGHDRDPFRSYLDEPADGVTQDMVVTAPQARPDAVTPDYNDAPARPKIDPQYILNDDRIAPKADELKEILPHKGMFGLKGTLRDVLGTLGDAFLVQGGAKAQYLPHREQEKDADAMFGYTHNAQQAIERVAARNPELAQKLQEQLSLQENRAAALASSEGSRQDQARNRKRDDVRVARNQVARWVQAADTPAKMAVAMKLAQRAAEELGVTLDDLGANPAGLTADERSVVGAGDMTVNQQVQVPFTEHRLHNDDARVGISQQNADSARISATRPHNPPPRPRSDTDLEYYRAVKEIPAEKRSVEDRAWMKKYLEGTGKSKGSRISAAPPPPPPGGAPRQFRVIR